MRIEVEKGRKRIEERKKKGNGKRSRKERGEVRGRRGWKGETWGEKVGREERQR